MSTRPDYYAEARAIATTLFEKAQFDWSSKIEEAIAGGATATEILMRVRFVLRQVSNAGILCGTDEERITLLITQLDEALR